MTIEVKKGYNTSHTFTNLKGLENEFYSLIKSNEPENLVMRFPGGTIANKYDIDGNDYGWSNLSDRNYIEDFVLMCKATESDAILVLNLYEDLMGMSMFEKNMRLIERIESESIKIVGIELGNELNIYPEITGLWFPFLLKLPNFKRQLEARVRDYVALAKKYNSHIVKKYGYNCGVVVGYPKNLRDRIWNDVISDGKVGSNYIYHYYQNPKVGLVKAKRQFMDYVRSFDKPLWITEWGIQHGHDSTENGDAYLSDYMLTFIREFPNWCRESRNVDVETMHNLGGIDNFYNKYVIGGGSIEKRF